MNESNKTIWLVNFHAKPPRYEGYLKTIKFAQYLSQAGYEVYIFASNYLHNHQQNVSSENSSRYYFQKNYGILNFIHLKTIAYKNSSLLRILSLIQFSVLLFYIKKKFKKPDFIVHTAYIPFDSFVYFTAKSLKAKYFIDILDLWPESFVDAGLIKKSNPLLKVAYYLEKWIYTKSNGVIFCMEGGPDYIKDKKWDTDNNGLISLKKIHWISNGIDLDEYEYNLQTFKLHDNDLENEDYIKIVYLGSIRLANNLINLIKAASHLSENNKIKFLIYGDGNERQFLEEYCKINNIFNVIFKEKWVEPKYVPYILSKSSINILNYKQGFGKYGGSQSKLFQYIASGNPICSNINMNYCIIEKHKIGISKSFESEEEYAEAILSLLNLNVDELGKIKNESKKIIKEYDYKYLTNKLINIIEN